LGLHARLTIKKIDNLQTVISPVLYSANYEK
jgi:hypothetical protein